MKVKILTEIDVHEDGLHCGGCCRMMFKNKDGEKFCLFCRILPLDTETGTNIAKRSPACLAAQKAAEGMTAFKTIGKDEIAEGETGILLQECGNAEPRATWGYMKDGELQNDWEYCNPEDGDRFYPVPKEKE